MRIRFTKMHGLGNDFVMIDAVSQKVHMTNDIAKRIADRNFGIGCDQVLIVEPPNDPDADFRYRIFNNDGSEVQNCGNGARCFAVFDRQRKLTVSNSIVAETAAGRLVLKVKDNDDVTVNMGVPEFSPAKIPFDASEQSPTYSLALENNTLEIGAVSMGNPHAVNFVDHLSEFPVKEIGAKVESHLRFPNRVNAGFAERISQNEINLRVYERGTGETLACGTGACAAVASGIARNILDRTVKVNLRGGSLLIEWPDDQSPMMMTGPATTVFTGQMRL